MGLVRTLPKEQATAMFRDAVPGLDADALRKLYSHFHPDVRAFEVSGLDRDEVVRKILSAIDTFVVPEDLVDIWTLVFRSDTWPRFSRKSDEFRFPVARRPIASGS